MYIKHDTFLEVKASQPGGWRWNKTVQRPRLIFVLSKKHCHFAQSKLHVISISADMTCLTPKEEKVRVGQMSYFLGKLT